MVFVWSYLTDGDPAYTLVQVYVNNLIMLVLFVPSARPISLKDCPCFHRCHRSAFWAADKPGRPICPITITLQLHCIPEGVALIA
jgi:hypothetical protein